MACFVVPLTEAVVITAAKAIALRKYSAGDVIKESKAGVTMIDSVKEKIGWLQKMLFGGSFLLAIEHIYHGEVILYPPFLTAMNSAADTQTMLHEMATVGAGMAVLTTAVWGMIAGISALTKRYFSSRNAVQGASA